MSNIKEVLLKPSYVFEVSWEVCNKVGGIHTVIATKALTMTKLLGDKYILIGPDIHREGENPEFEEDQNLLTPLKQKLYYAGIRIKVGRWRVKGSPVVILVDFSSLVPRKDEVLKFLWESYKVDSINGNWDYLEPVLFGFAAGQVAENYIEMYCNSTDKIVAHFHEWMTSSGGLYLRKAAPYVGTLFTTHATVMGRSIAGNGLPLYGSLKAFNADELAIQFGVVAKHSIEKAAANYSDAFLTVSDLTAKESKYMLSKSVALVTPNGFEDDFVWKGKAFDKKRKDAKALMIKVAEACLGTKFEQEPLIVGSSGRYEFKNKGLDVLIESLKKIAADNKTKRNILAYITVPAGNDGPRADLQAYLADHKNPIDPNFYHHTTHHLSAHDSDPIVQKMRNSRLLDIDSCVKVIFVPSYLNGDDGIFNMPYYELLAGMDITVYPSYYEPWGYTPLESVAFHVPTITTTLAGFGLWVDTHSAEHPGVVVVKRTDSNDAQVEIDIADAILSYANMSEKEYETQRKSAYEISKIALWDNLIEYYYQAYDIAIKSVAERSNNIIYEGGGDRNNQINFVRQQLVSNQPTWVRTIIERQLPQRLAPLDELSKNLWWSWTMGGQELFTSIDEDLWVECDRNPIIFLNRLSQDQVNNISQDEQFLAKMDEVYATFRAYMDEKTSAKGPTIGYFSMEYGLNNQLKIYSGGLGILAGDYLKEASDKNVPMKAVGLLYRYGYFTQKLSAQGGQEASYEPQDFSKLPITPVRDEEGNWQEIQIAFPGRTVTARIWRCDVGRTELYLLDTDHELNLDEDRAITHHLYGGDWENRIKQEIVLGIGGIRAMEKMGIKQNVYHCNEGHAAFIGLERIHNLITESGLSFSESLEVVRSSSLFTTHTPVPAGHDAFPESMIRQYMSHYPEKLAITWEQFINLGKTNPFDVEEKFSMSVLACNLSQEVNGVSWLHGEVSKEIMGNMWPGYFKNELHIGYVTNGVHFPTWTASNMRRLYSRFFPNGFMGKEYNIPEWQKVHNISDEELWKERMFLKDRLVKHIRKRAEDPSQFRVQAPRQIVQLTNSLKPDALTIGFARRFATYKRAHLLFTNLERLERLVNNPERPVQFVFAGKAHPNDKPGQDLIKMIVEIAARPQFVGKIIFLPNYDMELARRMVQGVDVWLNTPTRPLEASGTSGEKVVMNGGLHFSVLDGWWVEGYKEGAGWMLPLENTFEDENFQNELDAEMIYRTIEEEIVEAYYTRNEQNIPYKWLKLIKNSIADVASNFTTNRMMEDYQTRFYAKLYERNKHIIQVDFREAREIAAWKRKVSAAWDKISVVSVDRIDISKQAFVLETKYHIEVVLDLRGLNPEYIGVEMVISNQIDEGNINIINKKDLTVVKQVGNIATYRLESTPDRTGVSDYALRIYPKNPKLPHRMDFGLVKWI